MSDNTHHPGVRSLLAKFENSQSPVASPPSRGRSPHSSDTPNSTRPLSKVRASFVAVEGVIQSNPGSPLRKSSGRSDSPGMFGPKINEQGVEARRQNVVSPTPAGGADESHPSVMDQIVNRPGPDVASSVTAKQGTAKEEPNASANQSATSKETTHPNKEQVAPAPSHGNEMSSVKPGSKNVTKRSLNIHNTKTQGPSKPTPTSAVSTATKTSTINTVTKPPSAREVAKERANALAHKPSRASLSAASRTLTRATRGPTPSVESPKTSTAANGAKPRTKSPTKPVRLPASMTAPTQSSAAKLGSNGNSSGRTSMTPALTRKPSSLRSATGAPSTHSVTGATGSVRRQSSRPSLPAQSAVHNRPSSRASDIGTRPINEGFLARMMRPTASSASKTHDKPEPKASQKTSTASKASRPSMGRISERITAQPKEKAAVLRPRTENPQTSNMESVPEKEEGKSSRQAQESEKENIDEVAPVIPKDPSLMETAVEKPDTEASANLATERAGEKQSEAKQSDNQEVDANSTVDHATKAAETIVVDGAAEASPESTFETVIEDVPEPAAEDVDKQVITEVFADPKGEAAKEIRDAPAVNDVELPVDDPTHKDDGHSVPEVQSQTQLERNVESTLEVEATVAGPGEIPHAEQGASSGTQSLETTPDVPNKNLPESVDSVLPTETPSQSADEQSITANVTTEQQATESKQVDELDVASLALS